MNIDLAIKFNTIPPLGGQATQYKVVASLMLYPFFCTEADVLDPFNTPLKDEDREYVRQIIFNSSISVLRLTEKIRMLNILTPQELFRLERDITICMSTQQLAVKVNQNSLESLSRSKSLGDFSVATTQKNNPQFISKMISDSDSCIKELKELITLIESDRILPKWFVKASGNMSSTKASTGLWWPKEMYPFTNDAYASWKSPVNGNLYKKANYGYLNGYMNGTSSMVNPVGNGYMLNSGILAGSLYDFIGYDTNTNGGVYLDTKARIKPINRIF